MIHYEIGEKIGEDDMGVVYRAYDTRLDRDVALKVLSLDLTGNEKLKGRFIKRAKAASELDHPNICTIQAIEESDDGRLFMVMGYYQGVTIEEKLRAGPLPWQEVVLLGIQIATGLQAARENGIFHLNVNPANLMVTPDGVVKILDFGLSKLTLEIDNVVYVPPWALWPGQKETTGPASDIRALGFVLYQMATGVLPFQGTNDMAVLYAIVHHEPKPAIELRPDLPVDLDKILRRALSKDRRDRYRNIGEILTDLESLVQAGG